MPSNAIPVIDLEPSFSAAIADRRKVARQIDLACRDTGFFYVANHRIDPAVCAGMLDWARRLFALPDAEKRALALGRSVAHRGYEIPGLQTLQAGMPPDLKEGFLIGRELGPEDPYVRLGVPDHGPNVWPGNLPGFRRHMEHAHAELLHLGRHVMRLFALALELPEHYFDPAMEGSLATLRLLHYPPLPADAAPAQLGAGAHTDWGAITLLLQDEVGGLEVRGADDRWIPAPTLPGTFVVNIGDMMQRWTNDAYRSTLHRVLNNTSGRDRYSAPMFIDLNHYTRVECLPTCTSAGNPARYRPCTAGEHIQEMFNRTHGIAA